MCSISMLSLKRIVAHRFINLLIELQIWRDICKIPKISQAFFLKDLHQLHETLFDKLNLLCIPYTDNQRLFSFIAFFDLE